MKGRKNTIDDFWSKVDIRGDDECWEWTGHRNPKGYGLFSIDGRTRVTSRIALGTVVKIPDGKHVLHTCDNPPCCNPSHLFVGTNDDNVADKMAKGRQARQIGEKHPCVKLSEDDVKFILDSELPQRRLAKMFNVSQPLIWRIKTRQLWKHLP